MGSTTSDKDALDELFADDDGKGLYPKKEAENKTKEVFKGNWINCDHETYRTYVFPDGVTVTIERPVKLNVSKSGGHRVLDAKNVSHYIPYKWIHLYWETNDNNAFRF